MIALWNAAGQRISGGNGQYADPVSALTNLLYSGEQFDTRIGQQYLRRRYYDPSIGRFTSLDPFYGNASDPLSFHKYLYTQGNPVLYIDPTGQWSTVSTLASIGIIGTIGAIVGASTQSSGHWIEGFLPGWGSGRGLGAAIAKKDVVSILLNTLFLGLDLATFGGYSLLAGSAKMAPQLAVTASKQEVQHLLSALIKVATDPRFAERIAKAGLNPENIPKLVDLLNDYFVKGRLGFPKQAGVSWVDDEIIAITRSAQNRWSKLAHELTHLLDGIENPQLWSNANKWWTVYKAEYRAWYVQTGSSFAGSGFGLYTLFANAVGSEGVLFTFRSLIKAESDALGLTGDQ